MDLNIIHADYQLPCFTSISYVHFVHARPSFNFFSRLKDGSCGSQPPRWLPLPLSSGRPGPASPPLTHAWRLCPSDGVWPESTLHVRLGFRLPLSWTGCCRGSSEKRSRREGLWPPTNPLRCAGHVSEPRTQVPGPSRALRWLHFHLKSRLQTHDRKNCPLSWTPAPEKLWLINVHCRFKHQ